MGDVMHTCDGCRGSGESERMVCHARRLFSHCSVEGGVLWVPLDELMDDGLQIPRGGE